MNPRGLSAMTSITYVGSVYIFPGGRDNRRDDLDVMIRRIMGICLFTAFITRNFGFGQSMWAWTFNKDVAHNTLRAVLALHFIYLPFILASGFPRISLKNWRLRVMALRNLIIGPVSEEFVYRGVILGIYTEGGLADKDIIMREAPLYFGFAHIHHALMNWLDGSASAKLAFIQALAQFMMTEFFGTYACHWTLKTGSIWPAVASHIVCNYYGPPPLNGPSWYLPVLVLGSSIWAYIIYNM